MSVALAAAVWCFAEAAPTLAQGNGTLWDGSGVLDAADERAIEAALARASARGLVVDVRTEQLVTPRGARARRGDSDVLIAIPYDVDAGAGVRLEASPLIGAAGRDAAAEVIADSLDRTGLVPASASARIRAGVVAAVDDLQPTVSTASTAGVADVRRRGVPVIDAAVQGVVNRAVDSFLRIRNGWVDIREAYLLPSASAGAPDYARRARLEQTLRNTLADLRTRPARVSASTRLREVAEAPSGWEVVDASWTLLGGDALASEADRLRYYYNGYRVADVARELIATAADVPDYAGDLEEVMGERLAKNLLPHHYRLEAKQSTSIGAGWEILGAGLTVELSRHRLYYTNDAVPGAGWSMDIRCMPLALEGAAVGTQPTRDARVNAGAAAAAIASRTGSAFTDLLAKTWNTALKVVPDASASLMWDEDETDGYNSAELVTDAVYPPAVFEGFWPLVRVGTAAGVSGLGVSLGQAREYSWLGQGSTVFMDTGGDNRTVGVNLSRGSVTSVLKANMPSPDLTAYVATGACLGTGLQYTGGTLAKIAPPTTRDYLPRDFSTEALVALVATDASATRRAALADELIDLGTEVMSACAGCALDIDLEVAVSGPWPGSGEPDWNALRTSTAPAEQVVKRHFLAAEATADALGTALAGLAADENVRVTTSVSYRRASALAQLLGDFGEPASEAAKAGWQSAVLARAIVRQAWTEDLSAR